MAQAILSDRRRLLALGAAGAITGVGLLSSARADADGISALTALVQEKARQANDEALGISETAQRQRDLVSSKDARSAVDLSDEQIKRVRSLLETQKEIDATLEKLAKAVADLNCK